MAEVKRPEDGHPAGDQPGVERVVTGDGVTVGTYAGPVHVEWDPEAAVTSFGHLAFFIEYLKESGRIDAVVADCPLYYTSPNAPSKRDVLGTAMLAILAGQRRYAHIAALRGDTVNPPLLGMSKVMSEDSVRRGLDKIDEAAGTTWFTAGSIGSAGVGDQGLELFQAGVVVGVEVVVFPPAFNRLQKLADGWAMGNAERHDVAAAQGNLGGIQVSAASIRLIQAWVRSWGRRGRTANSPAQVKSAKSRKASAPK